MKQLSSGQTFITKYFVTAVWVSGAIWTAIVPYTKFGQTEGLYMGPLFLLPAIMSYLPMKISFDESKLIVSDWFAKHEYRFKDITSLEYSRPIISYHPYAQVELRTFDNRTKKIKFIPSFLMWLNLFFRKDLAADRKNCLKHGVRTTANILYNAWLTSRSQSYYHYIGLQDSGQGRTVHLAALQLPLAAGR